MTDSLLGILDTGKLGSTFFQRLSSCRYVILTCLRGKMWARGARILLSAWEYMSTQGPERARVQMDTQLQALVVKGRKKGGKAKLVRKDHSLTKGKWEDG